MKRVQYANEITAFLKHGNSVQKLISLLKKFEKCAGLKINVEKTEAMWLGRNGKCIEELNEFIVVYDIKTFRDIFLI